MNWKIELNKLKIGDKVILIKENKDCPHVGEGCCKKIFGNGKILTIIGIHNENIEIREGITGKWCTVKPYCLKRVD